MRPCPASGTRAFFFVVDGTAECGGCRRRVVIAADGTLENHDVEPLERSAREREPEETRDDAPRWGGRHA